MDKFINADKIIKDIQNDNKENYNKKDWTSEQVVMLLEHAPTADVVSVIHGHWIDKGYYVTTADGSIPVMTCSVCNAEITIDNFYDDYCPNCGAKMDGKDGEQNAKT